MASLEAGFASLKDTTEFLAPFEREGAACDTLAELTADLPLPAHVVLADPFFALPPGYGRIP